MKYGDARVFAQDQNRLRLIPQLDDKGETIEKIIIGYMDGNQRLLNQMIVDVRHQYVGASYSTWKLGNQC